MCTERTKWTFFFLSLLNWQSLCGLTASSHLSLVEVALEHQPFCFVTMLLLLLLLLPLLLALLTLHVHERFCSPTPPSLWNSDLCDSLTQCLLLQQVIISVSLNI